MTEALLIFGVVFGFATAYVASLYSLAVYVDPGDVQKLYPNLPERRRRSVERLAGDPLAFVQIANVYKSFVLILMTLAVYALMSSLAAATGLHATALRVLGVLVTWLAYIYFVEYMPRRSARTVNRAKLLRHLWLITIIYAVFFPVVRSYRRGLQRVRPAQRVTEEDKEDIVERAIETLAEQAGIGETIIEDEKKEMIGRIFQLDQTVAREIMIPRINMVGIEKTMSFKDIREMVVKDGHSRYPVFDETIDRVIGLIYVKDLFNNYPEPGEKFVLTDHLREAYYIPETKVIGELLREFKVKRMHIAVVVDEYGGVSGLVTLEDIIEEIFGEIRDEHDFEQEEIVPLRDGGYLVNAAVLVEELQDTLDTDYELTDFDTVGGLIYDLVGSVPKEGQHVKWHDLEFEVDRVEGQRIISVRVRK